MFAHQLLVGVSLKEEVKSEPEDVGRIFVAGM